MNDSREELGKIIILITDPKKLEELLRYAKMLLRSK